MKPCPYCSDSGKLQIRSKATGMEWKEVACPECARPAIKRRVVKKAKRS